MATTTLSHVNTPPAQTWNYLRINDVALDVPATTGGEGNLPDRLTKIECGLGSEAVLWIDQAVYEPRLVSVPANVKLDEPIVIEVESDRGELSSAGVVLHDGAEATVVVVVADTNRKAAGVTDERAAESGHEVVVPELGKAVPTSDDPVSGSLVRVSAGRGSKLTVYEYVTAPDSCQHVEGVAIDADEDAEVEAHQYFLGGKTCVSGFCTTLSGRRSRLDLFTRYLVHDGELLDMNDVVRVPGKETKTNIDVSGVVTEGGKKTLKDTIDLICGCKGSKADENETVVVTGDDIVNKSLPVILCDEDDVQGNHGATIGSMSAEQLQYLHDRGLTTDEAEELFARAVIDDAAIHAPVDKAREAVIARAKTLLGEDEVDELELMLETFGEEAEQ